MHPPLLLACPGFSLFFFLLALFPFWRLDWSPAVFPSSIFRLFLLLALCPFRSWDRSPCAGASPGPARPFSARSPAGVADAGGRNGDAAAADARGAGAPTGASPGPDPLPPSRFRRSRSRRRGLRFRFPSDASPRSAPASPAATPPLFLLARLSSPWPRLSSPRPSFRARCALYSVLPAAAGTPPPAWAGGNGEASICRRATRQD